MLDEIYKVHSFNAVLLICFAFSIRKITVFASLVLKMAKSAQFVQRNSLRMRVTTILRAFEKR